MPSEVVAEAVAVSCIPVPSVPDITGMLPPGISLKIGVALPIPSIPKICCTLPTPQDIVLKKTADILSDKAVAAAMSAVGATPAFVAAMTVFKQIQRIAQIVNDAIPPKCPKE